MRNLARVILSVLVMVSLNALCVSKETETLSLVKVVKKNQVIQFLSDKGKVINTLSLAPEKRIENEVNSSFTELSEKTKKIKQISKTAIISTDNKKVLLDENDAESGYIDDKGIQHSYNEWKRPTGNISFIDENGQVLWGKKFKKYHSVIRRAISENNEIIAVVVSCDDPQSIEADEPFETLHVYDQNGQELLTWPQNNVKYREILSEGPTLSPNGRYLSVVTRDRGFKISTIFIDVKRKSYWDAELTYNNSKISDDGIAYVRNRNISEPYSNIDLKNHLGD